METKKIAVACFIGGVLCCVVAFMFAPVYWWLGLMAGFAGGYISYEFREVCQAIPIALRAAGKGSVRTWKNVVDGARQYFSEPHPFIYPALAIAVPLFVPLFVRILIMCDFFLLVKPDAPIAIVIFGMFITVIIGISAFAELVLAIAALIAIFAFIGARVGERAFWWPLLMHDNSLCPENLEAKGLQYKPLTYTNVWSWIAKGIGLTVFFFVWTLWKYLAIGLWNTLCFFGRFAWHMFKLIHSKKRVLCAIDGTLGGAVSYIWLTSASMSFGSQVVLVIFGGLLGAVFGVVNWEIVSKRIFQVHLT